MNDPGTPPEQLVDAVRNLSPFLLNGSEMLGQEDLKITGPHPINAGGFANVWVGERNDGTTVAIKSYRYYASSSCLPIYLRMCREALTCSHLNDGNKNFVPFIGVYSTFEHPFCLVFELMDMNLREYLRNNRDVGRTELLLEISRGLRYTHSLGIAHGNLDITNILVDSDGHARVAGLGTAFVLSTTSVGDVATTASDVRAFALLAWEIFAGQVPFSNRSIVSGVYSAALNGHQLTRPSHPELSCRMWKLIVDCSKSNPAQRKPTMAEIVTFLEAESNAHKLR
ncbi:kinase-like protein [Thelephora ganbajun]|uniref:Kinase-like protein n=1 Tax=Thelephora ganbajun TaxID=370292 RepID=A0ACB6ZBM4_THEGA|nr:kinase-like protein [Thelephora ganbajun]